MDFVYLSPHLDDAVYSCGGLIAKQVRLGHQVRIVTVCAGDPPVDSLSAFAKELHARWGAQEDQIALRRKEDRDACALLGAEVQHWKVPDAIYRRNQAGAWLYRDETAIFGPLHADEEACSRLLGDRLREHLSDQEVVVAPLGIGGHVDHRLVRSMAEHACEGLWYYRDLPYAWRGHVLPEDMNFPEGEQRLVSLQGVDVEAWMDAASCYQSQLSTFWESTAALRRNFSDGFAMWGGLPLILMDRHWTLTANGEE